MSTIAYRNGILAGDRQVNANGGVCGRTTKVFRLSTGGLAGIVGDLAATIPVREWLNVANPKREDRPDIPPEVSFEAFLIKPNGSTFWVDKHFLLAEVHGEFFTSGSGSDYALGAFAMGASAEEAVRAASRFDHGSGAGVDVLHLRKP